jgi:hypothetical protein
MFTNVSEVIAASIIRAMSKPRAIPTLFPTGPVKVCALAVWFLYLKPIPRARPTHRPDVGGSKDL